MCEINLVILVCYCEVIVYFINTNSRVLHFADGPLGLVSQTPAH